LENLWLLKLWRGVAKILRASDPAARERRTNNHTKIRPTKVLESGKEEGGQLKKAQFFFVVGRKENACKG